ncbi:LapA family protein [Nocardioides sp. T2.26MG-1]|uniref:LapA family protein n=1 Tax=Nocardioides sp. T2.26MG-1 TaxID=3041166 RepID=UPI002477A45A|nr:LapA family protein [Nocardioides sp. T2.26MG-1]CAI9401883.1 putative membrane protein [Nocardioides sp. T2.26MG-1]
MTDRHPDPPPEPRPDAPPPGSDPDPLRGSRTSGVWLAVIALAVVLVLLVVFIAQNTQDVHVSFLGWDGQAPLAVTLLVAAVSGIVLTGIAGSLRIFQLRRRVRRTRRG